MKPFLQKKYNIKPKKIKRIKYGVINDNYLVQSDSGDSYLFKVYKMDNLRNVKFELNILELLAKNNFPSPRIVRGIKNRQHFLFNRKPCVLFRYIPGSMIRNITKNNIYKIGKLAGKQHKILKNIRQPAKKLTWEPDDIWRYIKNDSEKVAKRKFKCAKEFVDFIKEEFLKLDLPKNLPKGITHQDVKPENIIIDKDGKISFIDYNNCYYGVLLYDVMTTVIWTCFKNNKLQKDLFVPYLKGYTENRKFTKREKEYLGEALKFRILREAFVWPLRWLNPVLAPRYAKKFLLIYKNFIKNELDYLRYVKKYI